MVFDGKMTHTCTHCMILMPCGPAHVARMLSHVTAHGPDMVFDDVVIGSLTLIITRAM
jgi:hypothetical protein